MGEESRAGTGRLVNRGDLADFLGISRPTLDSMVRRGCPFVRRGAKGREWQFDTAAVVAWQLEQARAEAGSALSPGTVDLELERAKRAAIDRQLSELELGRQLGELVTVDDVGQVVGDLFARVRARLTSLPSRVSTELARESRPGRVRQVLAAEIAGALDELAESDDVVAAARGEGPPAPRGPARARARKARPAR